MSDVQKGTMFTVSFPTSRASDQIRIGFLSTISADSSLTWQSNYDKMINVWWNNDFGSYQLPSGNKRFHPYIVVI